MLYISKNLFNNEYDIDLLDDMGKHNHIGTPVWHDEFNNILNGKSAEEYRIFDSGPINLISKINSAAKKLKIKFYNNTR